MPVLWVLLRLELRTRRRTNFEPLVCFWQFLGPVDQKSWLEWPALGDEITGEVVQGQRAENQLPGLPKVLRDILFALPLQLL